MIKHFDKAYHDNHQLMTFQKMFGGYLVFFPHTIIVAHSLTMTLLYQSKKKFSHSLISINKAVLKEQFARKQSKKNSHQTFHIKWELVANWVWKHRKRQRNSLLTRTKKENEIHAIIKWSIVDHDINYALLGLRILIDSLIWH